MNGFIFDLLNAKFPVILDTNEAWGFIIVYSLGLLSHYEPSICLSTVYL